MILQRYYLNCLAHASYLVADEQTKVAVVVDPQRDIEIYVQEADRLGLTIDHVFLTHFHADFVAGHLELRNRTGARIYLGAKAKAEYAFTPMADGDVLDLGRVRLQILETPGHTIESISILLYDRNRDEHGPAAVLTGDTLFIGDVGRPDLRASLGWSAVDLGRLLYHSLREKLLPLPGSTLVYPAHGAGLFCGKHLGTEPFSTIGEQRTVNYALQEMTETEFIQLVTADQPDAPAYFTYDAVLNTREHETLDRALALELKPLGLDDVVALAAGGAQLLDVRDAGEFAKAHVIGSLNVGLGGQYATWAGTVLDREKPIVIIAEPGRETEAAMRLGRIGLDTVAGYLSGGIAALESRHELVEGVERVTAAVFDQALGAAGRPLVVDVRSPIEWKARHIEDSVNVPLNHLANRLSELPRDWPMLIHCAGGYRSMIGASILQRNGFRNVIELAGGMAAWEAAKLPTVPALVVC